MYEISNVIGIWSPIIAFGNLLSYEKTKFYGGDKPFSFWFVDEGNRELIVYREEVQLSFSCPFKFENYPFDSNECTLEFGSQAWPTKKLQLKTLRLIYEDVLINLEEGPLILNDSPHPYEFEFNLTPVFDKTDVNNISFSYAGMKIKMKRKTLGKLMSSYYYPMAAFAFLSTISFLIKADVVSKCFYLCSYFCDSKQTLLFNFDRFQDVWE